jgi:hypothetical protein
MVAPSGRRRALDALGPEVEEEDVGDVDLADLKDAEGDRPHQDEGDHVVGHIRNRVRRPIERRPMKGQNTSSKTVKSCLGYDPVLVRRR